MPNWENGDDPVQLIRIGGERELKRLEYPPEPERWNSDTSNPLDDIRQFAKLVDKGPKPPVILPSEIEALRAAFGVRGGEITPEGFFLGQRVIGHPATVDPQSVSVEAPEAHVEVIGEALNRIADTSRALKESRAAEKAVLRDPDRTPTERLAAAVELLPEPLHIELCRALTPGHWFADLNVGRLLVATDLHQAILRAVRKEAQR